jgi:hypothetical protein
MKELRTGRAILGVLNGLVAFVWSTIGAVGTVGESRVTPIDPPSAASPSADDVVSLTKVQPLPCECPHTC